MNGDKDGWTERGQRQDRKRRERGAVGERNNSINEKTTEEQNKSTGDAAAASSCLHLLTLGVQTLVHVHLVCERVAQSQCCEKHLHANDKVLVTGGNCPLAHGHLR